ncbi:S-layer homology domain-containing protein [Paenibacillus agaridevorans]
MEVAFQEGLIQGRGNHLFAPNQTATRAEVIVLILTMLEYQS